MRWRLLVTLLLVPVFLPAQARPAAGDAARVIDSLARDFVTSDGAPGVAIAVVRGGELLALAGYGSADLEQGVAATAQSVYRIGSVTKQFTAAAILQLRDAGKLRLDDSIATYVDNLPAAWRGVRLQQLLNHTSGIPDYTELGESWMRIWGVEMTPDTILALTFDRPMDFAPGTKWQYDNTGYILLGMVIERVTGRSWGSDMQQRFAIPLGLGDTRECLTGPLIPHRVHGYDPAEGGTWVNAPYLAMSQPYAAGALCSTVIDLARWNRALHTGQVLRAETYREMTTPTGAAREDGYGFGIGRDSVSGHEVISHGGGIHGFISSNLWVPEAELSVTVLANSGSARLGPLTWNLVAAAMGDPLRTPRVARALPAEQRARYVGVYALELPGGPRDFTVAVAGDGLTGQLAGQGANPLRYLGDDTFGVSFDPALRIVFTVEGDRAVKMTLRQGGGVAEGVRKR